MWCSILSTLLLVKIYLWTQLLSPNDPKIQLGDVFHLSFVEYRGLFYKSLSG